MSVYSVAAAGKVLARIADGETLARVCGPRRRAGVPERMTVYNWARTRPGFRRALERAREAAGDLFSDDVDVQGEKAWARIVEAEEDACGWVCEHGAGSRKVPLAALGIGRRRRPSECNPRIVRAILDRIVTGESLLAICGPDRPKGFPQAQTVHKWLRANDQFLMLYRAARRLQADMLMEEMLAIADRRMPEGPGPQSDRRDEMRIRVRMGKLKRMAAGAGGWERLFGGI